MKRMLLAKCKQTYDYAPYLERRDRTNRFHYLRLNMIKKAIKNTFI